MKLFLTFVSIIACLNLTLVNPFLLLELENTIKFNLISIYLYIAEGLSTA
jgi:hypothetical protein